MLRIVAVLALWAGFTLAQDASLENQMLELINQTRTSGRICVGGGGVKVAPLQINPILNQVAQTHALHMGQQNFLSHVYRGADAQMRLQQAGYKYLRMSEIIFKGGSNSPERALHWWLNSPIHCRAIMNPGYTQIGVGLSPYGNAWAVELALPR